MAKLSLGVTSSYSHFATVVFPNLKLFIRAKLLKTRYEHTIVKHKRILTRVDEVRRKGTCRLRITVVVGVYLHLCFQSCQVIFHLFVPCHLKVFRTSHSFRMFSHPKSSFFVLQQNLGDEDKFLNILNIKRKFCSLFEQVRIHNLSLNRASWGKLCKMSSFHKLIIWRSCLQIIFWSNFNHII
jgi:hypothetical protein